VTETKTVEVEAGAVFEGFPENMPDYRHPTAMGPSSPPCPPKWMLKDIECISIVNKRSFKWYRRLWWRIRASFNRFLK
jgi:hypothetical protein